MKTSKWIFVCIIAVIVMLTVGIIYQFVKIKDLERRIDSMGSVQYAIECNIA